MQRRLALVAAGLLAVAVGGVVVTQSTSPDSFSGSELTCVRAAPGDGWIALAAKVGAPSGLALAQEEGKNLSAPIRVGQRVCYGPQTTIPPSTIPSTTAPPTTTPPTTPPPTTVPPTTTQPPSTGAQFVETFASAASLDRLGSWVYHRNVDLHEFNAFSGGSWQGDHAIDGTNCGTPDTKRTLSWDRTSNQTTRRANSLYWCPNGTGHFMTSMGDVDGYSIVAVWPNQVFASVESVCVDVTLTDLGTRQWLKFGVVTEASFNSRPNDPDVPGFIVSEVGASDVAGSLATADRLISSWSGPFSYRGGLTIGDTSTSQVADPSPNDNMTRHPVCMVDNGNGTITFTVAGQAATVAGSFPAGPVRVVLYQHSYTPSKSESGSWGTTFHWDNLIVT